MKKQEAEIISRFFTQFPVSHAIPRVNEVLALKRLKLRKPVLDLGCGDGQFSLLAFGRQGIKAGLDPNPREIAKARKSGAYQKVVMANGNRMPFFRQSYATVLANSVLEHIQDLEPVLQEVYRVLKKGGQLIATVPTPLVSDYQFWAKFIPGYARFKEKLWRHYNYFGESEWRRRLVKAGLKLKKVTQTNSQAAICWADIFFPLWWLGPLKKVAPFLIRKKIFGPDPKGATLVLVATKQ